jgi:hypothetical protein
MIIKLLEKKYSLKVTLQILRLSCFAAAILLLASCKKNLPPEEARTYLRAMDSELLQLGQRMASARGLNELSHLSNIKGAPLPFIFRGSDSLITNMEEFNYQILKGIYRWDNIDQQLKKTAASDSIIVFFPSNSQPIETFRFILSEWKEATSVFGTKLPEKISASISNDHRTIWEIELDMQMREGLPVKLLATSNFQAFSITASLKTKLRKRNSTATFQLQVNELEKKMINFQIITEVNLHSSNRLSFGRKTIEARVFPVKMIYRASDGLHTLRPSHFVDDFNQAHSIRLLTTNYNRIGNVELRNIHGSDKLNPIVLYQDGSEDSMEELLLSARKILNLKIVNH